jgi:hypothetical protein
MCFSPYPVFLFGKEGLREILAAQGLSNRLLIRLSSIEPCLPLRYHEPMEINVLFDEGFEVVLDDRLAAK